MVNKKTWFGVFLFLLSVEVLAAPNVILVMADDMAA